MKDIPGGPLRDIKRYDTVPLMVRASSLAQGEREFMREFRGDGSPRSISFAALEEAASCFARGLLELGPAPVVALSGRNGIDWATVFLGTLFAGGVVVPIDRELPPSDISGIIHYSRASVFVFDGSMEESVHSHLRSGKGSVCSRYYVMNGESSLFPGFSSLMLQEGAVLPPFAEDSDVISSSVAVISYTSGTMGAAKGVVLSHGNILSDLQMMLASAFIRTDEVFLSVLPFHHMYECVCGFLCPFSTDAPL